MKFLFAVMTLLLGSLFPLTQTLTARSLSSDVVLYQVQTRGVTTDEDFVQLTNIANEVIDLQGWCIQYLPASGNVTASAHISCITLGTTYELAPYEFVSFATAATTEITAEFPLNGGLNHSGGHVRLLNAAGLEIDRIGWGTALQPEGSSVGTHSSSQRYSRVADSLGLVFDTDNNQADFATKELCLNLNRIELPAGFGKRDDGSCFADFCPNIDDVQEVAPDGYVFDDISNECIEILVENRQLYITELLPNTQGVDDGREFIELYNPHNATISLAGYILQVGPSYTKQFVFTEGEIGPQQYKVFSDFTTKIVLPNSSGVQLRLLTPAGNTVSETAVYQNADDDNSWAYIEDQWMYTNQPTPGSANKPYVEPAVEEVAGVTSVLAPCPAGKYRNPETNRCRNLETAVSSLVPCDEDEYRNPQTNRCNKLVTSSATFTPCKEGQERNPETNRCRSVSALTGQTEDAVPEIVDVAVQETAGTINWPVVLLIISMTVIYMLYEWRTELVRQLRTLRLQLATRSGK